MNKFDTLVKSQLAEATLTENKKIRGDKFFGEKVPTYRLQDEIIDNGGKVWYKGNELYSIHTSYGSAKIWFKNGSSNKHDVSIELFGGITLDDLKDFEILKK